MWQEEYEEYTKDDESHDEDEYYGGGEEEEQQSRIPVNTTDNLTYDLTNRIKALDARNHLNNLFQTRENNDLLYDIPLNQIEPLEQEYLISTSDGLYVMKPNKRACCICACPIERVLRYEPDMYYGCNAFYVVWFRLSDPMVVFNKDLKQSDALRKRLEYFCKVHISIYKSVKRTNELLLRFLEKKASIYQVPINYGWMYFNQAWRFVLTDGKTHNSRRQMVGALTLPLENRLVALSRFGSSSIEIKRMALEKASEIMRCFLSSWTRKRIWLYLHIAAVYSLMKQQGINFPTGLYMDTSSLKVRKRIEELFAWYDDPVLSLSDDRQVVQDQLVFYRDQPILMIDERCTRENEKQIQDVLRTGRIKNTRGKESLFYPLYALPVVIGDGKGGLINSELWNHMEIDKSELSDLSLDTLREMKPAFYEYMLDFMKEVSDDINFVKDIRRHMDRAFDLNSEDMGLHHDAVVTTGVLAGVQEKVTEYYKKIYSGTLPAMVAELAEPINQKDYFELYQQVADCDLINCDLHTQFITNAQRLIEHGDLKILTKGSEKHFYLPVIRFDELVVFRDEEYVYITVPAFEAVCEACQCGRKRMSRKLAQEGLLYGSKINSGSKMTRMTVRTGFTSKVQISLYQMDAWRIMGSADENVAEDTPYKLLLGMDSHGRKRTWSGGFNSHIRITGCSGTGKSYLLRYLAGQLPVQGVKCIILDSSGDFSDSRGRQPEGWPVEDAKIVNMRDEPIELIQFESTDEGEATREIANRIGNTIAVALKYKTRKAGYLLRKISEGLQSGKLKKFEDLKEVMQPDKGEGQTARDVFSDMEDLWNIFPANARKFDWQFDKPDTTIINLHKAYSGNAENLVVEMILGEIVGKRMCDSQKKLPHLVVIMDECQRLNWNESSFASQLMKESRKYGISVWAGTQVLGANIMTNALGQCGLMISFKPSGNNTAKIAKEMAGSPKSLKTKCEDRLTSLEKYQFLYIKDGDIVVASAP